MQKLATNIGALLSVGDVLLLSGDLGSGKTTFTKLLVSSRRVVQEVSSPTFALVNVYEGIDGINIWHYDLYRLKSPEEIYELGLEESLKKGITIVEWPAMLDNIVLRDKTNIDFAHCDDKREAIVSGKYVVELDRLMI